MNCSLRRAPFDRLRERMMAVVELAETTGFLRRAPFDRLREQMMAVVELAETNGYTK